MLNFKFKTYACFVCLIVIVLTNAQESQKTRFDKISEYFYYKCYGNSRNTKVFDKLFNDTVEFIKYMETASPFISERRTYFCGVERKELSKRIEQVANDLTPCLHPEEKYLSDFVRVTFNEFLHFLCHNDGENLQRLFSAQGKTCSDSINNENSHELDSCFGKIFRPISEKFVTKKELCDNMVITETCFNNVLQRKCPHSKSMHELNEQFFRYVGKTCSGGVFHYHNTMLLVMSVVVPYIIIH